MVLPTATSCVLIVDFQGRLLPALHESEIALANAWKIARAARILDIPILATEQNSRGLGVTDARLREFAVRILEKSHFDATMEPAWPTFFSDAGKDIVVVGSEAHVCVLQTVLGLLDRGYKVWLVSDAVASRSPQNKSAGLSRAERQGAVLVTAEMVMFEWLGHCGHPKFREVLALIK